MPSHESVLSKKKRWRENALAYFFLAPSLIIFATFLFYPMLRSVYLSMTLTDPRGRVAEFVWFDNFVELFQSGQFYSDLKVTLLFILYTVPTSIIWALLLAAFTHNKLKGMKIFQFVFSLPLVISVGTGSIIWLLLFHPTAGMLNYFLSLIHIQAIPWLTDPAWALISVSLMTVWMNMGFLFIVLSSGMQGVPEEIYESAKIDGSGPVRTFLQIVLPLLSPTLFFALIVSVIGAFQAFGQINILTKGGPMDSTNVVVYSIYQEAFVNFRFGTGSAEALILFFIILILTVLQFTVLEKKVHYQ
ncbi:sugar ABC transporter permease [Paenibacillus chitinolyticus]|uniref:Sugar ABC transporter permease n=1 Tax=Paenibacillus chitinolyticus TaxID=79263 RepID=A0A410WPE8_9BACL|nr:sugar ABC transporter permease [Paenibacillus chitinolyticus]MCY9590820.1 sugar ABC transporter permease [Paenibacillus chitinolyticus]MCY9598727.1 sugar ABC transporter permease [Paenibacillus chitinolyticus]QAV16268.1 sugar ABC transporter permease [Paenibacillus chitinolyticus]